METIEQGQYRICNDRFSVIERRMAKVEAEAQENKAWRLRVQFSVAVLLALAGFIAAVVTIIHNARDFY